MVNYEWYTTICLPEVIGEVRQIIPQHDNANSHTFEFLTDQNIELLDHLPYSLEKPFMHLKSMFWNYSNQN